ncbi:MAG: N-acetylmuramoyl-L-alanine amidase [Sulfurovum sp.]|nr:N-acetylmuramoyl-L-alanine amidase [Sulfurovaceae bacterium]
MRFIWLILFLSLTITTLFSDANILKKVEVRNKELHLTFSRWLNIKDVKKMILYSPPRVVIDIKNSRLSDKKVASNLSSKGVKSFRISQYKRDTIRIVIESYKRYDCKNYQPMSSRSFYHITLPKKSHGVTIATVIEGENCIAPSTIINSEEGKYQDEKPFMKNIFTSSSSNNTKKRYIIVVDAGHGGHDSGAVGTKHHYEKTVVLQISKRVTKYLKSKGFIVKMTRNDDRFIKLKNRTKFANRNKADIFVSIHANAVGKKSRRNVVHGVETYFLQTTRSARASRVAAKENSVVLNKNDRLSNNVILNSVLSGPKLVQSHKLAIDIQNRVISNLRKGYKGVNDGGVRPAPFWVLVGAQMPSVLVEVGYITHPKERRRLFIPLYQDRIARGIAEGVQRYLINHEKEIY